jgi:hypothetical protein
MSTARLVLIAACSLAAVGCRSSEPAEATRCDAGHARALQAELEQLCPIGLMSAEAAVPLAPWQPEPTVVPHDALRIEVGPSGVRVGHMRLNDIRDLHGRLVLDRELAASLGRGPLEWVLVIDKATSRGDVHAVAKGLVDAGERKGRVMLATSAVPDIPMPRDPKKLSELVANIAAEDPSQRATLLADAISRALPPCPQLVDAFGSVAALAARDKCSTLAQGFSQGLVACGCPKEDELLTLFYALAVGGDPPTRLNAAVRLTLDPEGESPPGTTWGGMVSEMQAGDLEAFWVAG